jgi:hypothetical protein
MIRFANAALITVVVSAFPLPLAAQARAPQQPPGAGSQKVNACSLLSKAEVKKYLPWIAALDAMAVEEEPLGSTGSSCNYPSVTVQVLAYSQGTIDAVRKRGGLETLSGVGDEGYFYNNPNGYAEIYTKVGKHLLTVQANAHDKVEAVKPGALNLAKALVAKLR